MPHCLFSGAAETGVLGTLAATGFVGGFTHCAGMCGPFVLAMAPLPQADAPVLRRLRGAAVLPYHCGRMTTYMALGLLCGGILQVAFMFAPARAVLGAAMLMMAAVLFMAAAVPAVAQAFPFLLVRGVPRFHGALARWAGRLSAVPSPGRVYLNGVLLGFMPCGMVLAALMTAAVLGSPLKAALGMGLFALATVPGLVATATGGQALAAVHPRALAHVKLAMLLVSTGVLVTTAGGMILS